MSVNQATGGMGDKIGQRTAETEPYSPGTESVMYSSRVRLSPAQPIKTPLGWEVGGFETGLARASRP